MSSAEELIDQYCDTIQEQFKDSKDALKAAKKRS